MIVHVITRRYPQTLIYSKPVHVQDFWRASSAGSCSFRSCRLEGQSGKKLHQANTSGFESRLLLDFAWIKAEGSGVARPALTRRPVPKKTRTRLIIISNVLCRKFSWPFLVAKAPKGNEARHGLEPATGGARDRMLSTCLAHNNYLKP